MVTVFSTLILISALALIISVLFQESKTEGMGAITGGSQNVWGRGAPRTKEVVLHKITIVSAVVFMASAIIIAAIQ